MKVRIVKIFGREVLRIESHYEATVSDVVRAMIENRAASEDVEYVYECSCGDEEGEDDDDEEEEEYHARFADMTERIVWDARTDDYPFPKPLFENENDDDISSE